MRWSNTTRSKPKNGTIRKVPKFAFWPKQCGSTTVWLEDYMSVQRYNSQHDIWVEQSTNVIDYNIVDPLAPVAYEIQKLIEKVKKK